VGFLIFSLGLIWGIHEKSMEKLFGSLFDNEKVLLSFFVSLAFTAGYLIDLIDDMEEDRKAGQKNLAERIGVKLTFLLSSFLFLISYVNGFFVIKQNISKIIFTLLFLTHLLTAAILFLKIKFLNSSKNIETFIEFCSLYTASL
jgi:1,4-dihydroxy-2-naphthoate octaprenyltransferase